MLAASQAQVAPQGFGKDVAGDIPVPAGWHITAFTSPKAADSLPAAGDAISPEQKALDTLSTQQVEEQAHEEKPPVNELAEALGNLMPSAEEEVEAAPQEPVNDNEGLVLPPGYRFEGFTAAAAAVSAAPAVPHSLMAHRVASDTDDLPIPAGYRIEGFTPAAAADVGSPIAPIAAPVNAIAASAPQGALKVPGLDVPAGWKIESILPSDDAPPAKPAQPAVAKAKVVPMPKAATVAVSMKKEAARTASKVATPVQKEAWPLGPVDSTPGVLEGDISVLEPVGGDEASLSVHAAMGQSTPFLTSETLGHITSVDCLTAKLEGRPCDSEAKPALRKTLLTKARSHAEESVIKVASAPKLRAMSIHHKHQHAMRTIKEEKPIRNVIHRKPPMQHHKEPRPHGMADLVSLPSA